MRTKCLMLGSLVVCSLTLGTVQIVAHHSFAAEFDANQPVAIRGVVARVEWTNPHAFLYIDTKDDGGNVVKWALELSPPSMLIRYGWKREMLKIGDTVGVTGFRAKDGTKSLAIAREITLADGRKVLAGPGAGK